MVNKAERFLWVEDEKEILVHFRERRPVFTIGLNYGLYLRVECVGAILTVDASIFKGTQ
jgi:hypothetical protein